MKLNEIENKTAKLLITYQSKQIQLDLELIDKTIDALTVPYIVTKVCETDDGKKVDLSHAYKLYVQIPGENRSMRFLVHHKRMKDADGEFEVFTSELDGKELEQRNAYRLPLGCRCDVTAGDKKTGANLKDLSITGLCTLGMSLELKIGQQVRLSFEDKLPPKVSTESPIDVVMDFSAIVVRERKLGKFNEYGLRITACDPNKLTKYISIKQRMILEKERGGNK